MTVFTPSNVLKNRYALLVLAITLGIWCSPQTGYSQQLNLSYGSSPEALAETITGNGVQILNPTLTCADSAYGEYEISGISGFPDGPGIVLSTGNIDNVRGPNFSESTTTEWDTPGDPLLTQISGNQSYDACKLEFDVVPVGDTLRFDFTFASEEYDEYVGTPFNDAFGFFISGPGITGDPGLNGEENIALIPGMGQPVEINSVNNGNPDIGFPAINPQFFVSNPPGFSSLLQYDGWTQDIYAEKVVQACDTFHLKLVIADIADREWDSSVFIEKIESNSVVITSFTAGGIDNMVEGCNDGTVTFTREPVTADPLVVTYFIEGTAINGVDYPQIGTDPNPGVPKTITIPANQATASIQINPFSDGIDEGDETIQFYVGNPSCSGTIQDSLTFIIQDSLDLAIVPPLSYVCLGDSLQFQVESSATDFAWSPSDFLNDPTLKEPVTTPTSNTTYTLTASAAGCTSIATADIQVSDVQLSVNTTQIACEGSNSGAIDLTISGGQSPFEIDWVGPDAYTSSDEDLSGLVPGTYVALVTDRDGCTAEIEVEITETPGIEIELSSPVFTGGDNISCFQGTDGQVNASVSGGTTPYTFEWDDPNSQTTQNANGLSAGTYTLTLTDANGCAETESITLTAPELVTGNLLDRINVLCKGEDTGEATVVGIGGHAPYTYQWNTTPPQSGPTAAGLSAGFYIVTITDVNGCTGNTEVEIEEPAIALGGVVNTTNILCKGDSAGIAEALIQGGVSPYTFAWSGASSETGATLNNLPAGNYSLTVTDANGCNFTIPFSISEPPAIDIDMVTQENVSCAGENSGSITVNATGGSGGFTYEWNTTPASTGSTLSNIPAGFYTVVVEDSNGCSDSLVIEITEPDTLTAAVVSQSNPSCNPSSDGSIEVEAVGGTAPYSYVWNTVPLTQGATLSGIGSGTYEVTITDANGCSTQLTMELTAPDPLIITLDSVENVLCNGAATGSASVSVAGGTPGYSFSWNDPANQATSTATGLPAGSYTVIVTDNNGCTAQLSVTLTEPQLPLNVTLLSSSDVNCFGESTGMATVEASGGSGNYSYSWNDPDNQTGLTASGLAAGTYTVTVTDNNGCDIPATLDVTIAQPAAALDISLSPSSYAGGVNVVCADDSTATIDLEITGGTAPYDILWNLPGLDTSTDEDLSNLAPGTYSVTVTDANGCEQNESITLTAPDPISISFTTESSLCFGSPTGAIDLTVSGGVAGYTILWNGPNGFVSSDLSLANLEGGVYYLTVTDAIGCVYQDAVTVTQPDDLVITVDSLSQFNGFNTSCWNSNDGSIYTTPSGGTPPYSYQWNSAGNPNFSNQEDIINQSAGTYEAVLVDDNGCVQSTFIDLTAPDTLDIDFDPSLYANGFNVSCNGASDGSVEALPSGGTAPYTFLWVGENGYGPETGNPITGLPAGEYSVMATDANGCSYFNTVVLSEPDPFSISLEATDINGSNISCQGADDGNINLILNGGQAPFQIAWTGPNGFTASGEDIADLAAGQYCVSVTDANACEISQCITLSEPDPVAISLTPTVYANGLNLNCDDSSDGEITSAVSGGTSPYTYFWTGPDNFTATTPDLSNLEAGNYCLSLTDANGCESTECIVLTAPDPIEIVLDSLTLPLCSAANTASIEISVNGGAPAYTYAWTGPNGFTSADQDIFALESGDYCLTLTDMNGCTAERCFTVVAPSPISLTFATSTFEGGYEISCNGNADGSINTAISGGTAPYSYSWTGPGGFTSSSSFIENLNPGTYCLEITDANNCTISECVTIDEPVALTATPGLTLPDCADGTLATVDLNITGGAAPYTFNWSNGDATETVQLDEGTYQVIVTDANGCSITENVSIQFPNSIVVIPSSPTFAGGYNLTCNGDNSGSISINVFGGSGNATASWTGPNGFISSDMNINGLEAGQYCVTITDDLGCMGDTCITLTEPDALALSLEATNVSCASGQNGSISAAVSGGIPTYAITWAGPNGFTASGTELSNLEAGNYCATATDFNGCTTVSCIDILQPDSLSISLSAAQTNGYNIACHGDNSGQITTVVTDGTAPYSYQWQGPGGYASTDANPMNLFAGEYCLTVTDANGCTLEACITLTQAPAIGVAISVFEYPNGFNVSCADACDGSLTTTLSGGASPITVSWLGPNGFTSAQNDLSNLCYGTYNLSLTDANGCEQDTSIVISRPEPLSIDLDSPVFAGGNEVGCYGDSSGAINTTISGGIAPLTIAWTGPDGFTSANTNLTDLPAGNYTLTVTDNFNCSAISSIELTQPDTALSATADAFEYPSGTNISCHGATDGSIDGMADGGTAPYQFNWNGPDNYSSTDQNIDGLAPGDYTLVVEDANSCVYTVNITLTEPASPLEAPLTVDAAILCANDSSGALTVNAVGGSPGYSISWSGPNGFTSTDFSISDLIAGTYSYTVEDINGCTASGTHSFTPPAAIQISGETTDAECQTGSGIVNITVSNGAAPYFYLWSNGSTGQDLIDVMPGSYSVVVTDNNGCEETATFEVGSFNTLEIDAEVNDVSCHGDANGMIDVMVIEGEAPVDFAWTGPDGFAENGTPILNLSPGEYNVTATDNKGCTVNETFEITQPDELTIAPLEAMEYSNGFNLTDFGSDDGLIYEPEIDGGTTPYSYLWTSDNGYNSTSGSNQLNLIAGTYLLEVTDANMCTDTASIILTEPTLLEIPNGISPNGDGFNDSFQVRGLDNFPVNTLIVFNRWGNQVYEESNYRNSNPWYGTNKNGDQLAEGTYFVIVELSGADNLKGYLEIRR